jgi:hypothetical protein
MVLRKIRSSAFIFIALLCAAASARAQSYYYSYHYTYYQQPYGYHYTYYQQPYSYHYTYYQQPVAFSRPEVSADDSPAPEGIRGGSRPTVPGDRGFVRHGVAYAPTDAPESVKHAIWAANALRWKPYKWGGGHGTFFDSGYDCSGTVSFALHSAGVLNTPMPASDFLNYGRRGRGRWITVYSRSGHTFAVIAGLRLDTTGDYGTEGPRWHPDCRDTWGYEARHPEGL